MELAIGEQPGPVPVIDQVAERPRRAGLWIVGSRIRAPEGRESIVPEAEVQHELVEKTQFRLGKIRLDVAQSPVLLDPGRNRVLDIVRRRRDQLLAERICLAQTARIQILTDSEGQVGICSEGRCA